MSAAPNSASDYEHTLHQKIREYIGCVTNRLVQMILFRGNLTNNVLFGSTRYFHVLLKQRREDKTRKTM